MEILLANPVCVYNTKLMLIPLSLPMAVKVEIAQNPPNCIIHSRNDEPPSGMEKRTQNRTQSTKPEDIHLISLFSYKAMKHVGKELI